MAQGFHRTMTASNKNPRIRAKTMQFCLNITGFKGQTPKTPCHRAQAATRERGRHCSLRRRKTRVVRAVGLEPTRACAPRIFLPATAFAAAPDRSVWGLDYPFTITGNAVPGAARLVSTPSPCGAWLGIAILQVSPNLSSSASGVSPGALKTFKSDASTIPPRPHTIATYTRERRSRKGKRRGHRACQRKFPAYSPNGSV